MKRSASSSGGAALAALSGGGGAAAAKKKKKKKKKNEKRGVVIEASPLADRTLENLNQSRSAPTAFYRELPASDRPLVLFTTTLREITIPGRAPAGIQDRVRKSIAFGGFVTEEIEIEESKYIEIEPTKGVECFFAGCARCVYSSAMGDFGEPDPLLDRIFGVEGGVLCDAIRVSALCPSSINAEVCAGGHVCGTVAVTQHVVSDSGAGASGGGGGGTGSAGTASETKRC